MSWKNTDFDFYYIYFLFILTFFCLEYFLPLIFSICLQIYLLLLLYMI